MPCNHKRAKRKGGDPTGPKTLHNYHTTPIVISNSTFNCPKTNKTNTNTNTSRKRNLYRSKRRFFLREQVERQPEEIGRLVVCEIV
jgi:hypothetical protein